LKEQSVVSGSMRDYIEKKIILTLDMDIDYDPEMTASEAEALLRKDLKELCSLFRPYGKDSLLLAALAYNIGAFKLLGCRY